MTFEEAVKLKGELPSKFIYLDMEYRTYITPNHPDDFIMFRKAFDIYVIDDNAARTYNTHNDFTLTGICYYRDANLFYHIQLPLP